jgi:hypothetical protein
MEQPSVTTLEGPPIATPRIPLSGKATSKSSVWIKSAYRRTGFKKLINAAATVALFTVQVLFESLEDALEVLDTGNIGAGIFDDVNYSFF